MKIMTKSSFSVVLVSPVQVLMIVMCLHALLCDLEWFSADFGRFWMNFGRFWTILDDFWTIFNENQ